jgi:hypothetical protein
MFETQINGGESECCDALINGVIFRYPTTQQNQRRVGHYQLTLCVLQSYGANFLLITIEVW